MTTRKRKYAGYVATARKAYKVGKSMYKAAHSFKKSRKQNNRRGTTKKLHVVKRDFEGGQGGTTKSRLVVKYKIPKAIKMVTKLGNVATHLQIRKFAIVTQQSKQEARTVDYVFNSVDIGTCFNDAARIFDTADTYITQNIASSITGQSKKFLLKSCYSELRIVNQSPSTSEFEIYVLMSKNSEVGGTSPEEHWNEGLLHQRMGQGIMSKNDPYTVPTTSKSFNLHWKVVKKITGSLNPGADHVNTFNFHPNRIIDTQYVNDFGDLKGITYAYMIVARGKPGDDQKQYDITSANKIGLCRAKLIGTVKNTYKTQMLSTFNRVTTFSTNLDVGASNLYVQDTVTDGPVATESAANVA